MATIQRQERQRVSFIERSYAMALVEALYGQQLWLQLLNPPLGFPTLFQALVSRNTRQGEKPYRFTWLRHDEPWGHIDLTKEEADTLSGGVIPEPVHDRLSAEFEAVGMRVIPTIAATGMNEGSTDTGFSAAGWQSYETVYPLAGEEVAGLTVLNNVPNIASIEASLTNYEIMPGIRVVPMSDFEFGPRFFTAADDERKAKVVAAQIEASGAIKPLIVVVEAAGPYVLEGIHRLYALYLLGKAFVPAVVVFNLGM